MKKLFFLMFLICLLTGSISAQARQKVSSNPQQQTKKKDNSKSQENQVVVREGKGMDGITIGRSTMDDVIKKFGKEYRWIVNKKYSYQMNYYRLGIAFYICQSDPKKEIFVIEMKSPYKVKTAKGIILGKSTVEDVEKTYGKLKKGLEYRGVSFYYNRISGKRIVTEIDITENTGIRQCKVGK